jgi:hypothetical protein
MVRRKREKPQEGNIRLSRNPLIEVEGSFEIGFDLLAG